MTLFKYTFQQQNGKVSTSHVDLENIVNFKLIKYDEKKGEKVVEKEAFILETKFIVQQPIEVPVEQARTKEQKMTGERNISHSKWELGNTLLSVSVREKDEVDKLKQWLAQNEL